jgi:hypothetical protein
MTNPPRQQRRKPDWFWTSWLYLLPALARRFRWRHGRLPMPVFPRTYNEKIMHRIIFDRRPILTLFAGKLESRDFVRQRMGGDALLARLLGVASTTEELARIDLPQRFVMKGNHASGQVRIFDGSVPVDRDSIVNTITEWVRVDYAHDNLEWCYHGVRHCVLFEEFLQSNGDVPNDYKFLCFDGRVEYIQFSSERFTDHTLTMLDRDWNPLPIQIGKYPCHREPPPRPRLLHEMREVAEQLSAGMDFVRVDLYEIGDSIKFGELTNYPFGAGGVIRPLEWDRRIGRHWRMPPIWELRGWTGGRPL